MTIEELKKYTPHTMIDNGLKIMNGKDIVKHILDLYYVDEDIVGEFIIDMMTYNDVDEDRIEEVACEFGFNYERED